MEESLEIPVTYQGHELSFPCRVIPSGYQYAFLVEIDGQPVRFEPDEEGKYRAALEAAMGKPDVKMDAGLLQAIARVIESVLQ